MTNQEFQTLCTDEANLLLQANIRNSPLTENDWLQSMCYIPSEESVVLCYTQGKHPGNVIVQKCKVNFNSDSTKKNEPYTFTNVREEVMPYFYHANDITYNPNTDKLYLVPMKDSGATNVIYVLNSQTFAKEQEIYIGSSNLIPFGIAYDNINRKYYVAVGGTDSRYGVIKTLDESFNIVDSFELSYHVNLATAQNLECYDEKIYMVYNNKICVYDKLGTFLTHFTTNGQLETEGLASLGNGEFLLGKVFSSKIKDTSPVVGTTVSQIYRFNILDYTDSQLLVNEKQALILKGDALSGINYIRKSGKIVDCHICLTGITTSGSTVLAKIPAGFRPSHYMRVLGACSGNNFARFEISTNGEVKMVLTSLGTTFASTSWFELQISYIVE
ncbi:MAG: hypothetical protein HFG29_01320 [Eubacterium sp.]|nr:hypothetical protein [Eubacterium sp.]